jgi:DNA-binding CsgD family transcriptional regulator
VKAPSPELTERESEVLALVAQGRSVRQAADELQISENTVKSHRKSLYAKARVHKRSDAVDWYWANLTRNG